MFLIFTICKERNYFHSIHLEQERNLIIFQREERKRDAYYLNEHLEHYTSVWNRIGFCTF